MLLINPSNNFPSSPTQQASANVFALDLVKIAFTIATILVFDAALITALAVTAPAMLFQIDQIRGLPNRVARRIEAKGFALYVLNLALQYLFNFHATSR